MHCLKCGMQLEERLVDFERRQACPSCQWVFFNNPVPIAGVILTREAGILLVQRKIDPPHRYALIAGYLEEGESAEEAAVREVKEETGFDCRVVEIVGIYSCKPINLTAIFIVQHAVVAGGDFTLAEELADAKWFTRDALPRYQPHMPISRALRRWLGK